MADTKTDQPHTTTEQKRKEDVPDRSRKCPYLDTVDRTALDFDFEKQCSVTLSHLNVYACLVCGKFFQGRGINSQASNHALQVSHHVFINLHSTKIYCLPENYEVIDSSLDDIKYALNPVFTKKEVATLDSNETRFRTIDGNSTYQPGIIGFNDSTNQTSPINAILQALVHVPILRNFFIFPENYSQCNSRLADAFGNLVRKVWCKGLIKPQISPQEMIQAISVESKKHFESRNYEPIEFLSWFLNQLHRQLGGTKRTGSSPIHHCFQGVVQVSTYSKCTSKEAAAQSSVTSDGYFAEPEVTMTPFLHLSLDVPPAPVFTSESKEDIIPQVPLYELLNKFNGNEIQYIARLTQKKQYVIVSPPRYLILHIKRFTRNQYFTEKNHTIVTFPMQDLDIAEYCRLPKGSKVSTKYNLLANICHQGQKDEKLNKTLTRMEHEGIKGTCLMNKQNKGDETWYTIQDLIVEPTMPQIVALSEAYIQIYERID